MKKIILLFAVALFAASCSNETQQVEKYTAKGIGNPNTVSVLVLGNSVTYHAALPSIGWNNSWGMAASAEEKDFVHQLTKNLGNAYTTVDMTAKNISAWEQDFAYNVPSIVTPYEPDYLIVRLGENVPTANLANYKQALKSLIATYKGKSTKVIITGCFRTGFANRETIQQQVATENSYTYVPLTGMQTNQYLAISNTPPQPVFTNAGVQMHPNDAGMLFIAQAIYGQINP